MTDTWTTAGIVSQTLDTANNIVSAQVITFSQFLVLGPPNPRLYVPFVTVSSVSDAAGW
ncbi:MAG: hypothetical protein HY331_17140 [Chloroflexi bacterium]|nr:hypothetical protein [Chloroflexota bacterium]